MLPNDFSNEIYWKEIYHQPLSFWQDSLDQITRRHFGASMDWERAALGRNVVFLSETWVIKLGPPGWTEDAPRERHALRWVAGQLPVQTPEWLASGFVDAWSYLIQRRMPGRNLHELWNTLDQAQRERLAFQHGEILAALHALPLPDAAAQTALNFDWSGMLAEQRLTCAAAMQKAGVKPILVEQVERYLADADPVLLHGMLLHGMLLHDANLQADTGSVLLHGDLTHLNLFVQPGGDGWRITGLIDWGDAKLGPSGHEFISPGIHMYLGDRAALSRFYQGCGKTAAPQELMARAMLYYAEDFASILQRFPELSACEDWECVCDCMWKGRA